MKSVFGQLVGVNCRKIVSHLAVVIKQSVFGPRRVCGLVPIF